jgi:hypothetical protein
MAGEQGRPENPNPLATFHPRQQFPLPAVGKQRFSVLPEQPAPLTFTTRRGERVVFFAERAISVFCETAVIEKDKPRAKKHAEHRRGGFPEIHRVVDGTKKKGPASHSGKGSKRTQEISIQKFGLLGAWVPARNREAGKLEKGKRHSGVLSRIHPQKQIARQQNFRTFRCCSCLIFSAEQTLVYAHCNLYPSFY